MDGKVDVRYLIPLSGKYNKAVSRCLKCDHEFMKNRKFGTIFDNIIGFNYSNIGLVAIWECPECFNKWFYHGYDHYDYFLDSIDNGTQKHFNNRFPN